MVKVFYCERTRKNLFCACVLHIVFPRMDRVAPAMAELDFGDNELFQQLDDSGPPLPTHLRFTDDEVEQDEKSQLRSRLEESDDYIQRLTEENILVALCNSAFALDEDPQKMSSSRVRTTMEAFKVSTCNYFSMEHTENGMHRLTSIGSVLYFTTFNIDKLGQPLVNENAQLTEGWELPTYQQVFNQVIGTDGQEIEMKDKRPKSMCFNCGSSGHQLRDCPKPKDMIAINERRKEFNQSNNQAMQSNQRYHADEVEERFAKYKPGVMSEELLTALGIDENTLPPLIYRMRQLGYPPGWLKEAEMENSGLSLYDGNDNTNSQNISYDVSKLVDFPGFNVPAPHKMKDEFMHFGSIPMQSSHMKQNYAAYLSSFFPDSTPQSPEPMKAQDSTPQSPKPIKAEADNPQSPESDFPNTVGGDCASVEKITAVPHRSKFAAGIVPFEDTPEFTEVAEATGTYLRIRDLLKNSPRSLAKKK
uniref:Zinc finger CCHC domain-containing protein 8 n=1 Tax=Amphilophus citrinellus TaxID=61819 RepID=A0A3Q0QTM6_AMPCI